MNAAEKGASGTERTWYMTMGIERWKKEMKEQGGGDKKIINGGKKNGPEKKKNGSG